MIARFDAIEQLATGRRRGQPCDGSRTGRLGDPGSQEPCQQPDSADLVQVARVQALVATTTVVVSEAKLRRAFAITFADRIPTKGQLIMKPHTINRPNPHRSMMIGSDQLVGGSPSTRPRVGLLGGRRPGG